MAMVMTMATSMSHMIDMHNHMLPSVDDGASALYVSFQMISKSIEDGVKKIILTPHVQSRATKTSRDSQVKAFKLLCEEVKKQGLEVELVLGAEIYYRSHTTPDYNRLTLGDSKCLLLEFSPMIETPIEEIVYDFKGLGYHPIVAHIERYEYLSFTDYERIKLAGGYLQVNTNAILGTEPKIKKGLVSKLLKHKLIDIISTDAHNMDNRKPNMKECYEYVKHHVDETYLKSLFGGKIEELLAKR
jgi:protein-tyrosine phosphatase